MPEVFSVKGVPCERCRGYRKRKQSDGRVVCADCERVSAMPEYTPQQPGGVAGRVMNRLRRDIEIREESMHYPRSIERTESYIQELRRRKARVGGMELLHRALSAEARAILAEHDERINDGQNVIDTRDPYWDKDELQHFRQLVRTDKARRQELITIFQRLGLDITEPEESE